jgi:hypothetical protein
MNGLQVYQMDHDFQAAGNWEAKVATETAETGSCANWNTGQRLSGINSRNDGPPWAPDDVAAG